jgi:hypothetical protein
MLDENAGERRNARSDKSRVKGDAFDFAILPNYIREPSARGGSISNWKGTEVSAGVYRH